MEEKETWLLESKLQTPMNFKEVPLKLRLKILFGGEIWIASKTQIAIEKTELPPVPVGNGGIELYITDKKQ